ncbi:hypothetical protein [Maritalea sp.]|jgi:hypothetical protein|uniref:hypothetical protein n=1 Tax=Maritalea sp. TaxID=2003361 RepID=UPI0039E70AF7
MTDNKSDELQTMYRYEGKELVGVPIGNFPTNDEELTAAGYSGVDRFVAIAGVMEHDLFRKGSEFVLLISLDMFSYDVFYADNVPDYLRLVREVVNPLLVQHKHSGQ